MNLIKQMKQFEKQDHYLEKGLFSELKSMKNQESYQDYLIRECIFDNNFEKKFHINEITNQAVDRYNKNIYYLEEFTII